jgi:hypothetical protein
MMLNCVTRFAEYRQDFILRTTRFGWVFQWPVSAPDGTWEQVGHFQPHHHTESPPVNPLLVNSFDRFGGVCPKVNSYSLITCTALGLIPVGLVPALYALMTPAPSGGQILRHLTSARIPVQGIRRSSDCDLS